MTVRLRPLDDAEFGAWEARSKARYADDMVQHGAFPAEYAHEKAARDFARLLPDGPDSEEQHIWVVEDSEGIVGHAWLGERDSPDAGRAAFVYEIEIEDAYRGLGYGRTGMLLLEGEAKALGYSRIELNVFGGNEVARGLYQSLGYEEIAVSMGKELS
jgi:ribosomal protein S18 acetylase RimI-like enzyme